MKKMLIICLMLGIIPCIADVVESVLNVDATINKEFAPDTATVRFYAENSGTNLADIKKKNDEVVNAAITEIKKKLTNEESIKTIAFRVNNVYSYKDKVKIFQKYEVTNGFEVKLKDLDKVSDIIDTAMAKGIKRVDSLNFSIENGEALCNDLMAQSISMAKKRAEHLAKASNLSLDKPKNINPYCSVSNNYTQPRYYANSTMKTADLSAGGVTESIETGSINVRAGVNMAYYLK